MTNLPSISPVRLQEKNDLVQSKCHNIEQMKNIIQLEACFGINRVYLLDSCKNTCLWFINIYSIILICATSCLIWYSAIYSVSYNIYREASVVEYLILTTTSFIFQKNSLNKIFEKLNGFDVLFNINNIESISPKLFYLCNLILYVSFTFFEIIINIVNKPDDILIDLYYVFSYIPVILSDIERTFSSTLLVMIFKRVQILKSHIIKEFSVVQESKYTQNTKKDAALVKQAKLDIGSLHKAYEILHSCSETWSAVFGFTVSNFQV